MIASLGMEKDAGLDHGRIGPGLNLYQKSLDIHN